MTFLVFIEMFSIAQMMNVLLSLPIVLFLVASLLFTEWYFARYIHPVLAYLTRRTPAGAAETERRLRRFPLAFWSVFLSYILLAPTLVITSAQMHAGFEPQLIDWLRIHLVALIVTIVVGLPVFMRFLDLFGRALSTTRLITPHVTVRTKVFLIGALIPLLIDTLLVQYYWTRTGIFDVETFVIWLGLELLAVAGTLMLMRSFRQALQPLQHMLQARLTDASSGLALNPQSTDDIGVIAGHFQVLLDELRVHQHVLTVSNRVMHNISTLKPSECFSVLGNVCAQAVDDDMCFLFLHDDTQNELMCVAYTGAAFNANGHFRLPLSAPTLVAECFNKRKTALYRATPERTDAPNLVPDVVTESALLVPLIAENEVMGVLMSVNTQTQRNYSAGDVSLIEGVAREASLIIKTRLLAMQRAHTEERFKQLNELSQVTLESIGEGVITTDTFGAIIYMNHTASKLSGWTHAEARGSLLQNILLLRDETSRQDESADYYDRLTRASQSQYNVLVHRDRNKESYVEINSTPLRNAKRQVIGAVLVLRDVTEMRRLVHKMSYQTSHDALTGLINRREFEHCVHTALASVRRGSTPYVVCYIDLDQFKIVNDTCGHAAGDELVKQLSAKLSGTLGEQDILARLGGDEFGVLLFNCTLERGVDVAAFLLESVKALRFAWEDKTFNLAASIGVVPLNKEFSAITDVLRAADSACYVAKELGRNRI
ncbi:MAG: diguanylate cyclase, partial [Gammaproteobacteria bacterium]|nr:diguanylate cyclase [Gammaproteobacteria bacterium]